MRKSFVAALALSALSFLPASAQQLVTPTGVNGSSAALFTNPLPVRLSVDGTNASAAANPLAVQLSQSNSAIGTTNPLPCRLTNGAANIAAGAPLPVQLSQGNSVISLSNPLFSQLSADGTNAVDATHGLYTNLLQGNAVNALTNPIFAQISADGTNAAALTHPLAVQISVDGTNGSSATHPLAVQTSIGNAVISNTNGSYTNLLQGNTANSAQNPIFQTPGTTTAANSTSVASSVGGSAASISLTHASNHVILRNTHASQILYFAITGTATTSSFAIPAGVEEKFDVPGISSISVIGSGSSTTYSCFAD